MSGDTRATRSPEPSRATHIPFACPTINAGSATPTKSSSVAETGIITPVSFFVPVLLAVLSLIVLVLVQLVVVVVCCLTRLVALNGLVRLTTLRACTAVQGV
jgi:hypothetical protein